ncbi:hypothetical protein ACOSQ2_007585 [Xanthoceras sorbifolium]
MALSLKSLLFVSLFIAAMTAPIAEAQLGLVSGLLGLIRIQGTVFCTPNGNMDANGTATPVFPNALVQLHCGAGNVVSTAAWRSTRRSPTATPSCLLSSLQFIGNTLLGLLNVTNIIPSGFQFMA